MKKVTETYICDLCNNEFKETELLRAKFPAVSYCNDIDGMRENPYIKFVDVDLCEKCRMEATNLTVGFRGSNLKLKNESEGEEQ